MAVGIVALTILIVVVGVVIFFRRDSVFYQNRYIPTQSNFPQEIIVPSWREKGPLSESEEQLPDERTIADEEEEPVFLRDEHEQRILRFVNIGDWGNARGQDTDIFEAIRAEYRRRGFSDITANGDNNYGTPEGFAIFVQKHFQQLFENGVELHLSLGNHDVETEEKLFDQVSNPLYGEWDCGECLTKRPPSAQNRYYSFYRDPVRFIMLDSTLMIEGDVQQDQWAIQEIENSEERGESWQVVIFHHPVFSSAETHGSTPGFLERYRDQWAEIGVDIVFNGHDHTYERIKTTNNCGRGVLYIVNGAVRVRRGDIREPSECTQTFWDKTPAFLSLEASSTTFRGRLIDENGDIIDHWILRKTIRR